MPEGTVISTLRFTLKKREILRGHGAFSEVFMNSVHFSENFINSFLNYTGTELNINEQSGKSPHYNIMAGFTVSKKNIRKANGRIRVKRLLREAYRKNKHSLPDNINRNSDIKLVFTLSRKGLDIFNSGEKLKAKDLERDMNSLLKNINKYLERMSERKAN